MQKVPLSGFAASINAGRANPCITGLDRYSGRINIDHNDCLLVLNRSLLAIMALKCFIYRANMAKVAIMAIMGHNDPFMHP